MEERVATATDDLSDDPSSQRGSSVSNYEPIYQTKLFPSQKISVEKPSLLPPRESGIYVVQMPKDQIFSVPHVVVAERLRKPPERDRTCHKCLMIVLSIFLVLALIIAIFFAVLNFLLILKVPTFSLIQLHVKDSTNPRHEKASTHSYEIELKAKNENEGMGISYSSSDEVILFYEDKLIGKGKFPSLNQEAGDSCNVHLRLTGSHEALTDHEIEKKKSGAEDKKDAPSLMLKMKLPLKVSVGGLGFSSKVSGLVCYFKVKSLEVGKYEVLSQQCLSKFE